MNGLKVLIQLMSPVSQPNFYGFSPDPKPELIAWYPTTSPALSLSRGLERDRGVDETGHQISIFGRIGSRPFTLKEMQQLYLGPDGKPFTVTDKVQQQDFRSRPGISRLAKWLGLLGPFFKVPPEARREALPTSA